MKETSKILSYLRSQFDRRNRHGTGQILGQNGDSFDLLAVAQLRAAFESASYYERRMLTAISCGNDLELLSRAIGIAAPEGLFLEFGVASGRTITHLASRRTGPIYGFDSFQGLPEDWRTGYARGAFAGAVPNVPPNVHLLTGLFSHTLPDFLRQNPDALSFVHIDCDLYSSTKLILDTLAGRIVPGTILVFDEYFNYPGWKQHEFKAFKEFVAAHSIKYDYAFFVPSHQQVCVVIR